MSEIVLGSKIYELMKDYIGQDTEEDIILAVIDELFMLQKPYTEVKDTIYFLNEIIKIDHKKPINSQQYYEGYYLKLFMEELSPKGVLRIKNAPLKRKVEKIISLYISSYMASSPDEEVIRERGEFLVFRERFKEIINEAVEYVYNKNVDLETKLGFVCKYQLIKWVHVNRGQISFQKQVLNEIPLEGVSNLQDFAEVMGGKRGRFNSNGKELWGVNIPYGKFLNMMGESYNYDSTILIACKMDEETYKLFKRDMLNKDVPSKRIVYKYNLTHNTYHLLSLKFKKELGVPLHYRRHDIFKNRPQISSTTKFSFEDDYFSKKYSEADLRAKYDLTVNQSRNLIKDIRKKYHLENDYLRRQKRVFSNDLKKRFIQEWLKGEQTPNELMKKYNINRHIYTSWIGAKDEILRG